MNFNSISNNFPDSMFITWEIMNTCNYRCSYCSPELHSGKGAMPSYETALDFFKYIDTNVNFNQKLLSLTGGEPTLWPKLSEFLSNLPKTYMVEIVTNGSRTIRWWKELFEKNKNIDRISLSVHLEFADKDHIIEVCKTIHNECILTVMILFNIDFLEKATDIAESLKELNLNVSMRFKPIVLKQQQRSNSNYLDQHREVIKSLNYNKSKSKKKLPVASDFIVNGEVKTIHWANDLIAANEHSFVGMFCEAGKKRLYIDHTGKIYGATCLTARKNVIGSIDNYLKVVWPNGLICDSNLCPCIPDIRIPKWRINEAN
jgi:MoaA/NifB/PqqE/SkfB family radical SAM enzyme